jgi:hypothetical protein
MWYKVGPTRSVSVIEEQFFRFDCWQRTGLWPTIIQKRSESRLGKKRGAATSW